MEAYISDEDLRLELIKQIFSSNYDSLTGQTVQIGVASMDDAALVKVSATESFVIASDFIRGSGFYLFELGYLDYFDIGYFLIVANISDIAAMGAKPYYLTTIVRYKKKMTDEQFKYLFHGIKAAADGYGVEIIGGDTGSYVSDVFAATAIGKVKTEEALLRKNVQDGDLLCVTGVIGRPITALIYFTKVKSKAFQLSIEEEIKILSSWRRPAARVQEGQLLSKNCLANACQDVSDGLKATVQQLSRASGKTFSVYADNLPIDDVTKKLSRFLNVDAAKIAVSASVDFELLFTMNPSRQEQCTHLFQERGLKYTVIGEVNTLGRNVLINQLGIPTEFPGVAWQHQSSDYLSQILEQ